jgi:hypothetical protein
MWLIGYVKPTGHYGVLANIFYGPTALAAEPLVRPRGIASTLFTHCNVLIPLLWFISTPQYETALSEID